MEAMDGRSWAGAGSALASAMFLAAIIQQYFPFHLFEAYVTKRLSRLADLFYPYLQITIDETSGGSWNCNEAYAAVQSYLSHTCSERARMLRAEFGEGSGNLVLSMDVNQEVADDYEGARLRWTCEVRARPSQSISWYPDNGEKRYYRLTFHRRHRELVVGSYLPHVMRRGREVRIMNRQRKLYTNDRRENWYENSDSVWSHVLFKHPSTFDTLAMDPRKKQELVDDLETFRNSKEYYAKIGKAWKRGYLLYGPPGTGKSTMIAAIANYMNYDIYDVELTSVKDNTELRKLFTETTSKSIIVIEDIDCSLDLTGKRKPKKKKDKDEDKTAKQPPPPPEKEDQEEKSKVTLSGLLNFIDGLWSSCGEERLIIFTTNHVDKLDPALIRRGRMDRHIEMSYCSFEAFKLLARNYLDVNDHPLFAAVQELLEGAKITTADVAENLMPKSAADGVASRLECLIEALKTKKEDEEITKVVTSENKAKEDEEEEEDEEASKGGSADD